MIYNIVILDTAYHMYLDMVYMLMHFFDLNNTKYSLIDYNTGLFNDENNKCIFFGSEYYKYMLPKGSIIMEFDPINVVKNRLNFQIAKNHKIYSYSSILNDYITRMFPKSNVGMFYYGYSKYLDYTTSDIICKDIDICFVGSVEFGRKREIIKSIQDRFGDRALFFGGYNPFLAGSDRAKIYMRSKIILSLYTHTDLFQFSSGSRIFPAVSTGGFVIAERCFDKEQNSILEQICINTEADNLLDTIDYYLKNDSERETKRKEFYTNVKSIIPKIII